MVSRLALSTASLVEREITWFYRRDYLEHVALQAMRDYEILTHEVVTSDMVSCLATEEFATAGFGDSAPTSRKSWYMAE